MKKIVSLLTALLLVLTCGLALAEETPAAVNAEKRVFLKGEAPDFAEDEVLLDLYVAPVIGCDAMVMVSGDQVMVIDTATSGQYAELKKLLDALGITRIDYAFNTHPDYDHLGGMADMMKQYEIGAFLTGFDENFSANHTMQRSTVNLAKSLNIPITRVADGDKLPFGHAELTFIQQTYHKKSTNQLSVMTMVEVGPCRLLLTGDAENLAQQYYAANSYELKADILKYPHHGQSLLDPGFLALVAPELIFVTHGIMNTDAAQKSMNKAGVPYSFAGWGMIHISTNGEYWLVEHQLEGKYASYPEKYHTAY